MRAWTILTALTMSTFLYVTVETLPVGLLPQIAGDLGVRASAVGLLVTAYGMIVVVATIPLTRLTQRWPRRRLLGAILLTATAATTLSALAPSYPTLLAGRIAVALSQALFWAVVTPTAAAMFRPALRGKAISILYAGSSAAPLLGVPGGTWLGQQSGWRTPFLALAVLALVVSAVIVTLMPSISPGNSDADRGTAPDVGRYRGLAGLAGAVLAGFLVARHAWRTMVVLIAGQAVALAVQYAWGEVRMAAVLGAALAGLVLSALTTVLAARVLEVAPAATSLASAGVSTAFNVGITAGALTGSYLLADGAVHDSALLGALITLAGLAVVLAEPRWASAPRLGRVHAVVPPDPCRPTVASSGFGASR
jgi:predicted MFS family arabinose efflux permease